jgi:hypothetical protein
MRTRFLITTLIVITIFAGCKTETSTTTSTTETTATTSTTVTTATTDTMATDNSTTSFVKSWRMPVTEDRYLYVAITGLSTFYLEKDQNGKYINPMVMMIRDPSGIHKTDLELPGVNSAELLKAINKPDCTTLPCELPVVGIRVADGNTPLTSEFKTSADFDAMVLHLKDEANPAFTDFTDDARDPNSPPKAGGAVVTYLDLRGGEVVQVDKYPCKGHFDTKDCKVADIAPKAFARRVIIRFKAAEPVLQVINKANGQDPVHFQGTASVKMELKNIGASSHHMHLYSQLSKSSVCMPEIIEVCETGTSSHPDYIPGCGNTQWP